LAKSWGQPPKFTKISLSIILTLPLRIDLIIPVYNEEEAIRPFYAQLAGAIATLPYCFRIFFINDGSSDCTSQILQELGRDDERLTVVDLSRNFGHQAALTAGLDLAEGDYAISLDGDGQHPPERIGDMIRLAVQADYDIVLMQREQEGNLNAFKRGTSGLFYRLINGIGDTHIVPGAADFRLMSHAVVLALRSMPEYSRFLRGMVNWMGFRSVILPYTQPSRLAGKSKYTLGKMLRLATNAVFSFSLVPLYIAISIGVLFLVGAVIEALYVLSLWVIGNQASLAPGWSSLMFMLLIVGGSLMVALGLIGIYIGYIFQEVKRRPIYLIRRTWPKDQNETGQGHDRVSDSK
jgi:polyisoprenyl-phosphate glycosyltransferase